MAVYSINQNQLCRIEVKFSPGIPKIEILGSSSKSVKDSATKAKLLLMQMGYRFARNKKIYICIDPFVKNQQGLELAIFIAMKHGLENVAHDVFAYGDLSFDGKTSAELRKEEMESYIPMDLPFVIGSDRVNVTKSFTWNPPRREKKILWHPTLSGLYAALLYYEIPSVLIVNNEEIEDFLLSLETIFFLLHKSKLPKQLVTVTKLCPCGDIQRKSLCRYTKKKCTSMDKKLALLPKTDFVIRYQEKALELKDWAPSHQVYALTEKEEKLKTFSLKMKKVISKVPITEQEKAIEILFLSKTYQQYLSHL